MAVAWAWASLFVATLCCDPVLRPCAATPLAGLLRFPLLSIDPTADFAAAARIYRRCRNAGINPRGMVDCLIAAVAWRRGAVLLAHDADLDRIAGVVGIELNEASLRA